MSKNISLQGGEIYESPALNVFALNSEGVLCQSGFNDDHYTENLDRDPVVEDL